MNLKELENKLRIQHSETVNKIDTALLWSNVEPHINKQKKKRKALIILFLLIGLMGSIWLLTYQNVDNELISDSIEIIEVHNLKTATSLKSENSSAKITNNNELKNNSKHESVKTISTTSNNTVDANQKNTDEHNSNSNQSPQFTTATATATTTVPSTNNPINIDLENHFTKDSNEGPSIIRPVAKTSFQSGNSARLNNPNKANSDVIIELITTKAKGTKATESNSFNLDSRNQIFISSIYSGLKSLSLTEDALQIKAKAKKFYPYRGNELKKWSFELSGAMYSSAKEFKLIDDEMSASYSRRKLAESSLAIISTQAKIRYYIIPKVSIGIGAQYLRINERSKSQLNYTENIIVKDTIVGTLEKLDGSTEPILDDGEVIRKVSKEVSRINRYSFISIPLDISYHHSINNWSLDAGIGIIQNLSLNSTGYWHFDESTEYDINIDKSDLLKSKINVTMTAHVGVAFDVAKNFGLFTHLSYSRQTNSILTDAAGIKQRYDLVGAELGIRYHLFNKQF